jgi:hypothetical protein
MADIIADGMTKVSWVTTIATPTAPTATELNAGVGLEGFITPDGYGMSTATDAVDVSSLASTQDAELPGRRKDSGSLTLKHQGDAAAPFSTFASRPTGYLVVRFGVASTTTFAAAQKVDVMPAVAGDRQRMPSAKNEVLKFQVPIMVTGTAQVSVAVV